MADKIEKILNFKPLRSKEDVREFLGLTGYYRRFVEHYATVAEPLTMLLRKVIIFQWELAQELAYRDLQKRLTEAQSCRGRICCETICCTSTHASMRWEQR